MINSRSPVFAIALCFAAPVFASTGITLPVEVMGPIAVSRSAPVTVLNPVPSGTIRLYLQIHGLEYQTQIAIQVNNGTVINLNSSNVTILGLGKSYGGIGGGFSTLTMTVPLPAGTVIQGPNSIRFKFLGTDGASSGFRVLDVDFWDPSGKPMIDRTQVFIENPNYWKPPSTNPLDIAAGLLLWQTGALTQPVPGSSNKPLRAHCMDCHTHDGRDLKYFNYSNYAISARAQFHGLSGTQGDQIASYIRSLTTPNPGRPWNPPYQPGPGLDSGPAANWAAGAGIQNVLPYDALMQPYIAPTGTSADFNPNGNINIREIPIAFELPDWNRWLPRTHPVDAWGSAFTTSTAYTSYLSLRTTLIPNSTVAYKASMYTLNDWEGQREDFQNGRIPASNDPSWSNPHTADSVYGLSLWQNVKMWELNQEFGLEPMAATVFGPQSDPRAWYTNAVFQSSPSIMKIPPGSPGIGNGSMTAFNYFSFMWYYAQLILNNGNKQAMCTNPVDWGYFNGFQASMSAASGPQAMLGLTMLAKALNVSQNGKGPQNTCLLGWSPEMNNPTRLFVTENSQIWTQVPSATRTKLLNAYLTQWYAVANSFTPQSYYSGNFATPNDPIIPGFGDGNWATRMNFTIPRMKYWGVDPTLVANITAFSSRIWPSYNWNKPATATCSTDGSNIVHCTNDQ